jgi:cellulose synthase/poly-beta-1,6-N-acetylglucosamine synthase-like glycosyltransferase
MSSTDDYFERFGFCGPQVQTPPSCNLGIVIVVPCFDEPDIVGALESLRACDQPGCDVEVIVVVNSAANAPAEVKERNHQSAELAREYAHVIDCPDLPPKHAGVGLARKIGMDEALRRAPDGIIVNFDADCRCDPNYLRAIEAHFREHPDTPGCSIYFEHPPGAADLYELHLRYYVQGLRYAAHPYAFHTIGSSMAVRARAYMEQGGMNKRKAGEDFYFLQKVIALGNYTDLLTTCVIPSPRESHRVPFGTGNAVGDQLRGKPALTYPFEAFEDLKQFFADVEHPPVAMKPFLETHEFAQKLKEMRANTASDEAFRKRFFRWFNGFMAMKYIHYARDFHYGGRAVSDEPRRLPGMAEAVNLLSAYRSLQRNVKDSPRNHGCP